MSRIEGGAPRGGAGEGHLDAIVVGSGFGGAVAALRLAQKGHRVLLLEQGRRWEPEAFPRTNWDLRRWMWNPSLGMRGIFQMSFFEHITILHGVGVGGGSLVYAATLPTPPDAFFRAPSWAHLADWREELAPHYRTALRMLGAAENPFETPSDRVLRGIAARLGREAHFGPSRVGIFFGPAGQRVPDPFFGGEGPDRRGCTGCGACMTGCREGAKNSLDRNYLFLAERHGARILPEHRVVAVRALPPGGYAVTARPTRGWQRPRTWTAERVFLAAGVLGTVELLLRMRRDPEGLPHLSARVGEGVRTNSEALIGVVSPRDDLDFSQGVAITSILHTDEHSHVEPVRYGAGSGFFRLMALPHAPGPHAPARIARALRRLLVSPGTWWHAATVSDFARHSQVLLYMRTLEGTLSLRLGRRWPGRERLVTHLDDPAQAPRAFMQEATRIAEWFAEEVDGVPLSLWTETLLGVPSTAHILGGACMGRDASEGVIDPLHRVYGHPGLYVVDGSAVSANPGVNPSLTITALAERALARVPPPSA